MRTFEEISNKCNKEGEEKVRKLLIEKMTFAHNEEPLVLEWLRRKDEERANASASKRDEREERTLSIAEKALSIATEDLSIARDSAKSAREQARWAKWAAIIAAIAATIAVIAAREQIIALFK